MSVSSDVIGLSNASILKHETAPSDATIPSIGSVMNDTSVQSDVCVSNIFSIMTIPCNVTVPRDATVPSDPSNSSGVTSQLLSHIKGLFLSKMWLTGYTHVPHGMADK